MQPPSGNGSCNEKTMENGVLDGLNESKSNVNTKIAAEVGNALNSKKLSIDTTNDGIKRNISRVLVIYTGGTIGMVKNEHGVLSPQKGVFENSMRDYPQLHDDECWRSRLEDPEFDPSFLILPETTDLDLRIFYKILEYDTLLDSSDITEVQWIQIAESVMGHYEQYDGFVVLHGSDTMSYTASALSFMFEDIGKCVVITGSQSYGAGNIPSNRQDLFAEITAAVKRGVVIVNITQCVTGSVVPLYETGRLVASCGVVPGYDMTPEAALTKLSYVLSKTELSYMEKVSLMTTNIRGELTNTSTDVIEDNALIRALAAVSISTHLKS